VDGKGGCATFQLKNGDSFRVALCR
jgi:hypothetical protein